MRSAKSMFWLVLAALAAASYPDQPTTASPSQDWPQCPRAAPDSRSTADLVAELDGRVRERFLSYDEFGLRRIRFPQHQVDWLVFQPENGGEYAALCALANRGGDLAVLIGGRGLLGFEGVAPAQPLLSQGHSATLSEPVRLFGFEAGFQGEPPLPPRELLKSLAFATLSSGPRHGEHEGWSLDAFLVVASRPACVGCHNGQASRPGAPGGPFPTLFPKAPKLALGDTIGVTLYVHHAVE